MGTDMLGATSLGADTLGITGDANTLEDDVRWTANWARGYTIDNLPAAPQPAPFSFTKDRADTSTRRDLRRDRVRERLRSPSNGSASTGHSSYSSGHNSNGDDKRNRRDRRNNRRNNNNNRRHSNRRIARQQRANRWEEVQAARSFRDQFRQFDRGGSKYRKKLKATNEQLLKYVQEKHNVATKDKSRAEIKATAWELARAESAAAKAVRHEVNSFWRKGRYGDVPKQKPPNVIRGVLENFNSLEVFTGMQNGDRKAKTIDRLCRDYDADFLAGTEPQADWRFAPEERQFKNLLGKGRQTQSVVGYNSTEELERSQAGGTCLMAFDRFSSFVNVRESGADARNLGRWCWLVVEGGGKRTRIVVAYQPSGEPGKDSAGFTAWDQHSRYFESQGDGRSPRTIFFEQLVSQLLVWKASGEEIILLGDLNENVYTGRITKRLAQEDLGMTEQCLKVNGVRLPATHVSGSRPIDGVFATPGITSVNAMVLPLYGNLGDHRCLIIDFTSESVLGTVFPRVMKPTSRKLHCIDRLVRNYNEKLDKLLDEHRMYKKMADFYSCIDLLTPEEFLLLMDQWDDQLTDYMLCAENNCNKFKSNQIPWTPEVGLWIKRQRLLYRVRSFLNGRVPDPRNLYRDCKAANVLDPRQMTAQQLAIELHVCEQKLLELAKDAPDKRDQHLKDCKKRAKDERDEERANAIERILRREATCKRWKRVQHSTGKPHGGAALSVKVKIVDKVEVFDTEEGVFLHVSQHLSERFRLAFTAPCFSGSLFDDLGFIGNEEVVQQILEGTYVYGPDVDPATRLLFEEASKTYLSLSHEEVATYVSAEDFSFYWQRANERISSSYSRLHFSHYKAAAFNPALSALHAAKLSACARKGVPLSRWGIGLTVLLEKIAGYNFVHKLRAICLFEADFNWWNKLVFARRMMTLAGEKGLIPEDSFAKPGSNCTNAVMCKRFFSDSSRIMHHHCAIGSGDFDQCYDRTAHPPSNIALRAFGQPHAATSLLLTALQTMKFCLRTGFGESKQFYGGSEEDPVQGSGQGNGAAPSLFTALGTLVVNAYKRMGHGAELTSAYTARLFLLAAVMYVDDTDLLHWAPSPETTDEDLIEHVQQATMDWGMLAQSTGGKLKPPKCFVYFLSYCFVHGRARMKTPRSFAAPRYLIPAEETGRAPLKSHIVVPQPDGSVAPIPTLDCKQPSKMLGIHFAPLDDGKEHILQMCKKGMEWADRIETRPLPSRDAWLSYFLQLFPGMSWGLATVCLSPKQLDCHLRKVWYRVLPFLGVRRNIKLLWRILPERFQGLGMPNFVVVAFAAKVFFLQCHWGFEGAPAETMLWCYENFLIEVGLYGNIFSQDFSRYHFVATKDTWFRNFWELGQYLGVDVVLHEDAQLKPVREGDRSLIEVFSSLGYAGHTLIALNVMKNYHNVLHLSDLTCCDGRTIDGTVLSRERGHSAKHRFPYEKPRRSDFALWEEAVQAVSSATWTLPSTLGAYLREPHRPMAWRCNATGTRVVMQHEKGGVLYEDVYLPSLEEGMQLRSGPRFRWVSSTRGDSGLPHYASVRHLDEMTVLLHSHVARPLPPPVATDFLSVLRSFKNQSLWEHFICDGDGSWIMHGLLAGSLVIVHDGSYMREVCPNVCSAAYMLYCTDTGNQAKGTVVEWSDSADNYRGEILGGIMAQLVLRAASRVLGHDYPVTAVDCDNQGVVIHGNSPTRSLKEKQPQADVLGVFKRLVMEQPFQVNYCWVQSHTDRAKKWAQCSLKERVNQKVDRLCRAALIDGVSSGEFIESIFPFEQVRVYAGDTKVTGSLRSAFERHWGFHAAREHYHNLGLIARGDFNLVWWDGMERVMRYYTKMFCVFVTKQVSGCAGTNHELAKWNDDVVDKCPNCGLPGESTKHVTRCRDEGRVQLFRQSAEDVLECLHDAGVKMELIDLSMIISQHRGRVRWRIACVTLTQTISSLLRCKIVLVGIA